MKIKKTVHFIIAFIIISFCSVFVIFSALLLRSSYKDLRNKNHQYYWLKKSAIIKDFSQIKNGNKQKVTFNYKVNNKTIIGQDTVELDTRIERNKTIFIWYNPHKESESTIIIKVEIFNNIMFAFAFSILQVCFILSVIMGFVTKDEIINKIEILK